MKPFRITFSDGHVEVQPDEDIQAAITEARTTRRIQAFLSDKKPCVEVVKAEIVKE